MSRFSQFFGSSSSVDLPTGAVAEFPSGITPAGYVELNGACLCTSQYSSISTLVSNLTPSMHITHEIPLCGDLRCRTILDGSCLTFRACHALATISQWGSDCLTRIDVYPGFCCSNECCTITRVCYRTADGVGGFMDVKMCCMCGGSGSSYCNGPRYVTTFWDPRANQRIVAVGLGFCGASSGVEIVHHLFNFDCKCYIGFYCQCALELISGPIFRCCFCCNTCCFTFFEVCCGSACLAGSYCCLQSSVFSGSKLFCNFLGFACAGTSNCSMISPCVGLTGVFYEPDYCFGRVPSYIVAIGCSICTFAYGACCWDSIQFLSLRCCISRTYNCPWNCICLPSGTQFFNASLKPGGLSLASICSNPYCGGTGSGVPCGISSSSSQSCYFMGLGNTCTASEKKVHITNIPIHCFPVGGGYTGTCVFCTLATEQVKYTTLSFNTASGAMYGDSANLLEKERCSRSGVINIFWNPAQKVYFGALVKNYMDYEVYYGGGTCALAAQPSPSVKLVTSKSLPFIENKKDNDLGYTPTCTLSLPGNSNFFRDPSQLATGNLQLSPYVFDTSIKLNGYSNVRNCANLFIIPCIDHPCPGMSYYMKT